MTNIHRGEVEITLDGVDRPMRPTFESLATIENRTGQGIVELAQHFSEGRFGVQDVTAPASPPPTRMRRITRPSGGW